LPGQTAPADGFADKERHVQEEKQEGTVEDGLKYVIPGLHEEESNPSKDIQALSLADHRQENQEQTEKLVKHATPKRSRFSLRKKSFQFRREVA